jgi:hypothetical protein
VSDSKQRKFPECWGDGQELGIPSLVSPNKAGAFIISIDTTLLEHENNGQRVLLGRFR